MWRDWFKLSFDRIISTRLACSGAFDHVPESSSSRDCRRFSTSSVSCWLNLDWHSCMTDQLIKKNWKQPPDDWKMLGEQNMVFWKYHIFFNFLAQCLYFTYLQTKPPGYIHSHLVLVYLASNLVYNLIICVFLLPFRCLRFSWRWRQTAGGCLQLFHMEAECTMRY